VKQQRLIPVAARPRGVGLVELMIGLTAGLLLLGALSYLFLGARQLNRTTDDVSRMQESGRIALEIMGRPIRQAGARSDVTAAFGGGTVNALDPVEGASGAPDSLTVRYDVLDGGAANSGEVDCVGTTVAAGARITHIFAIGTTTDDPPIPALTCTTPAGVAAGNAPVVVMDNIEDMQITYGIDATKDGTIDGVYQPAPVANPSQVAAVRVSLLVRGPTSNVATNARTYTYNGASKDSADGFLRQVYTSTFTVRNQAK